MALGESDRSATLFTDGPSGFAPSLNRKPGLGRLRTEIAVQVRTIDSLLAGGFTAPTILKIDVEGAEGLCIDGAEGLLEGVRWAPPRAILLELHPDFLGSFGTSVEAIDERLARFQYHDVWREDRQSEILRLLERD